MLSTFKKVFPYILIGVGIGAIIHNWIPEEWVELVLGSNNPFGVVLATLVGVPMYADIFGTIPIAEALLSKGAQLGTILSFMMAVTTLSLPSMVLGYTDRKVNDFFYKALSVLADDLGMGELLPIVLEVGEVNFRCMTIERRMASTLWEGHPRSTLRRRRATPPALGPVVVRLVFMATSPSPRHPTVRSRHWGRACARSACPVAPAGQASRRG